MPKVPARCFVGLSNVWRGAAVRRSSGFGRFIRKKAIERVEDYELSHDLGWRTFHAEQAPRLKTGKRPPSREPEEDRACPIA
jgi:hypothetical protein